jgi:hypothetical protein
MMASPGRGGTTKKLDPHRDPKSRVVLLKLVDNPIKAAALGCASLKHPQYLLQPLPELSLRGD